jgi:outer membrane protein OmpA-like peptidoglycan-associated protein
MNHRSGILRGVLPAVALTLALAGCGSGGTSSDDPTTPPAPVPVKGSIVSTAGSANEMAVTVPPEISSAWTGLADKGNGAELVTVAGDGTTTTANASFADGGVDRTTAAMTSAQSTGTERSALAGLDAIASPDGSPVWVFSPLLDTVAPLDFGQLGFDESPGNAVKAVQKAKKLPDLKGRQVTFVVTPVAGEQKALSKLQVGYQRAVWEGLARAAGAKGVTFFVGTGTAPGTGTGPVVEVPDPNDKINAQKQGNTSTCTLPSPALFVADQPTLIDKKATLKALKDCLGDITKTTKITVEGHTAGDSGASNDFAKSLSTQRATEVAALLKELDVPAGNITKVVGYGATQPIAEPDTNPKNRAVVVTFTTTS